MKTTGHLLGVATLVIEDGGSEDEPIADAFLADVDGWLARIGR